MKKPKGKSERYGLFSVTKESKQFNLSEVNPTRVVNVTLDQLVSFALEVKQGDPDSQNAKLAARLGRQIEKLNRYRADAKEVAGHSQDHLVQAAMEMMFSYHMLDTNVYYEKPVTGYSTQRKLISDHNNKKAIPQQLTCDVLKLNKELSATHPKKSPRYREISKRLKNNDVTEARVRYIVEGPRRSK